MENTVIGFYDQIKKDIESYNDCYYKDKITKFRRLLGEGDYGMLYKLSTIFKKFVKNIDISKPENIKLIKSMVKKYTDDPYLISMINPCFSSTLRFKKLLESHNMHDPFLIKEFLISFYIIILYIPMGKISNLKLFESIQILWMIIDNIIDNKDMKNKKRLLKPIFKFLKEELYELDNINNFLFKNKDNLCISVIIEIYNNTELKDKKAFFRDVRKLLLFSYSKIGIQTETQAKDIDILHVSIKKSYLSHKLFSYCIKDIIIENEDFFYLCLSSQLSDDLMDMTEDLVNNGNTIFTSHNRKERSIMTITLLDTIIEKFPQIEKYMILSVMDAVFYNKHLHDPNFIKEITKLNFVNTSEFDLQELEKIIFYEKLDTFLDESLIGIYDGESEQLTDEQIMLEIEANC